MNNKLYILIRTQLSIKLEIYNIIKENKDNIIIESFNKEMKQIKTENLNKYMTENIFFMSKDIKNIITMLESVEVGMISDIDCCKYRLRGLLCGME